MSIVSSAGFAEFLYSKSLEEIKPESAKQAKLCLMDYLACSSIGETMMRQFDRQYIDQFREEGKSGVPFTNIKTDILNAAFLSGVNSHAAELDDGHRYAAMHLGASVISALLALNGSYQLDGMSFIKGVVIGYEAAIRLSVSMQPSHKKRGFHTTGTCGTVGAAMAVAAALNYDKNEFVDTLSAALTDAAGLLATNDEGALLKPYNAGRAASAGIRAAFTAKAGLTGRNDFLNTGRGFYHAYADEYVSELLTAEYDEDRICTIYRKLYPSCRHSHSAIEAVLKILENNYIDINSIEEIQVDTYDLAVKGHDHRDIVNAASAKMSIPYCLAVAAVDRKLDYLSFNEQKLNDPQINDLVKKITVSEDKELSALTPAIRAASVTIKTKHTSYTDRIDYPKGEPENPISENELEEKLYSLGKAASKNQEILSNIIGQIWNLETDYSELIKAIFTA